MNNEQTVFVVDDDEGVREGLSLLFESVGQQCELYSSAFEYLESFDPNRGGCLVLDIRMPRMTGLDLQKKLNELNASLPIVFITGHGDIQMAVEAMRRGAQDFIRKPFREQDLLDTINEALDFNKSCRNKLFDQQEKIDRVALLTEREYEIFSRIADGDMNKVIGIDLGISERTVEVHRSQAMKKLGVRTLAQLVRIKFQTE
ncbi:response regulator transcription factor [Zhongshania borealis]|uniref:Oxygen response regulator transcription factor FixJ n=1 Tax=Zhongshania borealis TaxID=889488 RepID=A0ABP7W6Y1_9GAMM